MPELTLTPCAIADFHSCKKTMNSGSVLYWRWLSDIISVSNDHRYFLPVLCRRSLTCPILGQIPSNLLLLLFWRWFLVTTNRYLRWSLPCNLFSMTQVTAYLSSYWEDADDPFLFDVRDDPKWPPICTPPLYEMIPTWQAICPVWYNPKRTPNLSPGDPKWPPTWPL